MRKNQSLEIDQLDQLLHYSQRRRNLSPSPFLAAATTKQSSFLYPAPGGGSGGGGGAAAVNRFSEGLLHPHPPPNSSCRPLAGRQALGKEKRRDLSRGSLPSCYLCYCQLGTPVRERRSSCRSSSLATYRVLIIRRAPLYLRNSCSNYSWCPSILACFPPSRVT